MVVAFPALKRYDADDWIAESAPPHAPRVAWSGRLRRGRCRARPNARASAPPHPAYHRKAPAPTHRTIRHPVCAPTI